VARETDVDLLKTAVEVHVEDPDVQRTDRLLQPTRSSLQVTRKTRWDVVDRTIPRDSCRGTKRQVLSHHQRTTMTAVDVDMDVEERTTPVTH